MPPPVHTQRASLSKQYSCTRIVGSIQGKQSIKKSALQQKASSADKGSQPEPAKSVQPSNLWECAAAAAVVAHMFSCVCCQSQTASYGTEEAVQGQKKASWKSLVYS